jgi:hypothetical protein
MTPIAPAFCAFKTLNPNSHDPRLITAILPPNSVAFPIISQASVVSGEPKPSSTITRFPVIGVLVSTEPN